MKKLVIALAMCFLVSGLTVKAVPAFADNPPTADKSGGGSDQKSDDKGSKKHKKSKKSEGGEGSAPK